MSSRPSVLLALTPLAERAIEPFLFGEDAAVTPLGSVAEADELTRAAHEHSAQAILISPGLAGISAGHCERARAAGLRLIGIALDEHDRHCLQALPVDAILDHDAPPQQLQAQLQHDRPTPIPAPAPAPAPAAARASAEGASGTVLAVIGCKGAPGASECAASLAALSATRWPTLLLELDMLGGGLDVRIGADPQQGSILALIRAAATGEAVGELLDRWVTTTPAWPPVLLAPPDPTAALQELAAPGAIAAALEAMRSLTALTVCDVGFLTAATDEIPPQARVHREALICADAVLLVLGARDTQQRAGYAQLQLLLDQLAISPQRLRIAINGIGAPGAASEHALNDTLLPRLAEHGLAPDAWLAWDQRGLARAHRKGQPLALAHPRSSYSKVLTGMLDELFLPQGKPRERKHRLTPPRITTPVRQQEEVALPWRR